MLPACLPVCLHRSAVPGSQPFCPKGPVTRRASVHLQCSQTLAAELQRQRLQQADGGDAASGAGTPGGAAEQAALSHEQREAGQGAAHEGAEPFGTEAELGESQTSGGEEQHAAGGEGEGRSAAGSEAPQAPDPAHLSVSHAAAWAAHHITANSTSNGAAGSPRPGHARPTPQEPTPPGAAEEDGWQLVSDQAAAWKLQGGALLARAAEHPSYSRDREGFRNILMTAMMSIPWCGARKGGARCGRWDTAGRPYACGSGTEGGQAAPALTCGTLTGGQQRRLAAAQQRRASPLLHPAQAAAKRLPPRVPLRDAAADQVCGAGTADLVLTLT